MDEKPVTVRFAISKHLPRGKDIVRIDRPGETIMAVREGVVHEELIREANTLLQTHF